VDTEDNLDLAKAKAAAELSGKADNILQRLLAMHSIQKVLESKSSSALEARVAQIQQELIPRIRELGGLDQVDKALLAGNYGRGWKDTKFDFSWLPEDLQFKEK